MDQFAQILLYVHIASGMLGLLSGTVNLFRRKGDQLHRRIGIVFTWAMISAGTSAILITVVRPNAFLTVVGIFTLYMVGTGKRYIQQRMREVDNDAETLDWLLTWAMAAAGMWFTYKGILFFIEGNLFGMVYLVFAIIGLLFVRTDIKNYRGKAAERNYWLLAHLQRMTGAYIASLTAFLVVNADKISTAVPPVVYWLLPTAILTPMIVWWSRKYGIK